MNHVVLQSLGWLGFLNRPFVLEQFLCAGLVFALMGLLQRRLPGMRRASRLLLLLLGVALATVLAALLGRRFGLLLLMGQIIAAYWVLRLVERLLLKRVLPPAEFHNLVSRFLRPAFALSVLLVLLDAVASLRDLASISLGTWFGSEILLGTLFNVLVVLYFVVAGSQPSRPGGGLACQARPGDHGG